MPTVLSEKDEGHPHELQLTNCNVPFKCDGCKQLGFGICYQCPNRNCDFILHKECGLRLLSPPIPFLKDRHFHFQRKNLLEGIQFCYACTLEAPDFVYQCDREHDHAYLHPCCTKLPKDYFLEGIDMKIHLSQELKSKCLHCLSKKRPSSTLKVQGWAYVSKDGNFCYHIACMKEALLESWTRRHFNHDKVNDGEKLILDLESLASNEVIPGGQSSKARKGIKKLINFLKLVVSAIFGDPVGLTFNLIEILRTFS